MARNIKKLASNFPRRMFTSERRLFLCLGKEKGEDYPSLCEEFKNKLPKVEPPSRYGLWKMVDKLCTFKTLQDRRPICQRKNKVGEIGREYCFFHCHCSSIIAIRQMLLALLSIFLTTVESFNSYKGLIIQFPDQ